MGTFAPYVDIVILAINFLSILVLVWGVLICAKRFIAVVFSREGKSAAQYKTMDAKIELGRYVLLGLEILIIADIIATIVHPDIEEIIKLAAIVAIRTVISYFLNKEIETTNKELSDELK